MFIKSLVDMCKVRIDASDDVRINGFVISDCVPI